MKLQIELNDHPYDKDLLYAAICLRGGYITKRYILEEKNIFVGNYAFFNVLFNYFRIIGEDIEVHFDVLRASASISFCAKSAEFVSTINRVLHNLFNHEYTEENFVKAKAKARDAFAQNYKDGAFRARLKAFEFSDLNKHFILKGLIKDIEEINFETFKECAKTLIVPGNICIYISGEMQKISIQDLYMPNDMKTVNHMVTVAGEKYSPYMRQDAHITNVAREEYNLMLEAFSFINDDITNFTKLLILELLAEQLPIRGVEVWVDSLDASMIFASETLREYKSLLIKTDKASFEANKKRLLEKYIILMEKYPEHFAIKAANMMSIGVYPDQYISFIDTCSYDMFVEIFEKADCIVSEAQIVFTKGE